MKPTFVFATNNQHKIEEIKSVVGNTIDIITLQQAGIEIDIPEPYKTLEENASNKSKIIYQLTQQNCFGEDTGLEVKSLNGEPGVLSARYAGEEKNFKKNIEKLLFNLQDKPNREARFRTVISLLLNNEEYMFEGICYGEIAHYPKGNAGFGYDAVFIPRGSDKSFGEMTMEEKNKFSHRKKAVIEFIAFMQEKYSSVQ